MRSGFAYWWLRIPAPCKSLYTFCRVINLAIDWRQQFCLEGSFLFITRTFLTTLMKYLKILDLLGNTAESRFRFGFSQMIKYTTSYGYRTSSDQRMITSCPTDWKYAHAATVIIESICWWIKYPLLRDFDYFIPLFSDGRGRFVALMSGLWEHTERDFWHI